MRLLDLGSGAAGTARLLFPDADEIVTVDLDAYAEPDVVADVRELPDGIGQFDAILASHILEHLPRLDVLEALRRWASKLVPGGALHVLVPDLMWAVERITRERKIDVPTMMHIYGDGGQLGADAQLRQHHLGFDVKLLRSVVASAGLVVREATVTPYQIVMRTEGEEPQITNARQIYVVGVKPTEESE